MSLNSSLRVFWNILKEKQKKSNLEKIARNIEEHFEKKPTILLSLQLHKIRVQLNDEYYIEKLSNCQGGEKE